MRDFDEQMPITPSDEPTRHTPEAEGQAAIDAFANRTPVAVQTKTGWVSRHRLITSLCGVGAALAVLAAAVLLIRPWADDQTPPTTNDPVTDTSVVLVDKSALSLSTGSDGIAVEDNTLPVVTKVTVNSLLHSYTLTRAEDGVWSWDEEPDVLLNAQAVATLTEELKTVIATDTIATHVTDMATYGLNDPTLSLAVTYADGSTAQLDLAAMAVGNNYYVRADNGDAVYMMDRTLADAALQSPLTFVSLQVMAEPSINKEDPNGSVVLKELWLTGPVRDNVETVIRRVEPEDGELFEDSTFLIEHPYLLPTDTALTNTVSTVTGIYANEVVAVHPTDEQKAAFGLDQPRSVARIDLSVFTTTTDDNGEVTDAGYYNTTSHIVMLGNKTPDGTAYYAMADVNDVVYLVDVKYLPWAEKTYHDFANAYLFYRKLTSLSSITCTLPDGTAYEFAFEHTPEAELLDDELTVTVDGVTYPTDEFRILYQVLLTLYRTGAAPAEPEGDPLLTVQISSLNKDLADATITIYEHNGSVCIARTQDGDTYKMTASRVLDAIEQIKNYINGDPVINRF